MSDLASVREAVLVRDPQPDDVIVLRVDPGTTTQQATDLQVAARRAFPCKVVVLSGVDIVSFEFSDRALPAATPTGGSSGDVPEADSSFRRPPRGQRS